MKVSLFLSETRIHDIVVGGLLLLWLVLSVRVDHTTKIDNVTCVIYISSTTYLNTVTALHVSADLLGSLLFLRDVGDGPTNVWPLRNNEKMLQ